MLKRLVISLLPIAIIIAFPLILRKPAESIDLSADQLVIVTPHNSFAGDGNRERLNGVILRNLKEIG